MKKRWLALGLTAAMAAGMLTGCGGGNKPAESTAPSESAAAAADGSVYFLNFKPEQDEQWQAIAKAYTESTGIPVTVVTAASGQYETHADERDGQDRGAHPVPGQRSCGTEQLEGLLLRPVRF